MKIVNAFLSLIVALLFLTACQETAPSPIAAQAHFFDLKNYFAKEIKKLSTKRGLTKTTQINGKKESHIFDTLNFAIELAVFIESDINRLAWIDQYEVDSTFSAQETLEALTYRALKPELKTQKLHIAFSGDQPSLVQVNRLMENALMNASMALEYRPGESYRIQSNQKLRIAEEREMVVEVDLN